MAARPPAWFLAALAGLSTLCALMLDALWATGVVRADLFVVVCGAVFHAGAVGGWWQTVQRMRQGDDAA